MPVDPTAMASLGDSSAVWGQRSAALAQGLTVLTGNLRPFTPTGVATPNPWQGEGEACVSFS